MELLVAGIIWYIVGLVSYCFINYRECRQIEKDMEKMRKDKNYHVVYLSGIPKFYEGFIVSFAGGFNLLYLLYWWYQDYRFKSN